MRKDITLQELISYLTDLSVKYRLTTNWDMGDYEEIEVNEFYKHFFDQFTNVNQQLVNLEKKMIKYWESK